MASVQLNLGEVRMDDSQIRLQGAQSSLEYQLNSEADEVGYRDAAAYDAITKRAGMPALDLSRIGDLERTIAEGEKYVSFLYTYRSLFQPLGRAKPKSEEVKPQFIHTICATMHPAITGLFDLTEYVTTAVGHCVDCTRALTSDRDPSPRELTLEKLVSLLDTLVVIDVTRASKACLQNDFSFYKRQTQSLMKREVADALKEQGTDPNEFSIAPENQMKLAEFLQSSFFEPRPGGQPSMVPTLVGSIKEIPHFEKPVTELLMYAQRRYEDRYYVLPKEKWRLLRVMCVCLVILGWTDDRSAWTAKEAKAHMAKEIKLEKVLAHLREYPVIPLFGDMQLAPAALLEKSPFFAQLRVDKPQEAVFVMPADAQGKHLEAQLRSYSLGDKLQGVQAVFDKYSATVSKLLLPINKYVELGKPVPLPMASEMHAVMMEGVRHLTDWSEMVLKLAAWKYARPLQQQTLEGEAEVQAYELAVRLNYSPEEKNEVVDMIGYIKGLASVLKRAEKVVAGVLRMSIHRQVQEVVQHVLTDSVMKEDKKGRVTPMIQALQDLVGDWNGGQPPIQEPFFTTKSGMIWHGIAAKGGSVHANKEGLRKIPERIAAPTRTQLVLVRSLVEAIRVQDDGKRVGAKEAKELKKFLDQSFFYGYLLNVGTLADTTADMGDLWYRERYLEVAKQANKEIVQFPIRMSLPWILIDHIVNSPNSARMENVLYTLDIYNDAAMRALDTLGKRYVFDEVQAELNLCFDQVVYLIGERIYVYYKQQAAGILMDKKHRTSQLAENIQGDKVRKQEAKQQGRRARPRGAHHIPTCASSVEKLLSVRNMSLVGRVIDLNRLMTQQMKKHLMKNLEAVISRFETSGVAGVKELEMMLNSLALTHELLSEHLELDSFEGMLKQVNDDLGATSFHGRIVIHALEELITDFFPHWVYRSSSRRFVRADAPGGDAHEVPPPARPNKLEAIDQVGGSAGTGTRATNPSPLSKYMSKAMSLYNNYVGVEHLEALIRVLGPHNMPLIIYQLMKNLDMQVSNVLTPYMKALAKGFPERTMPVKDIMKLVNKFTATAGMESMVVPAVFQIFEIALKDILKYPDMKPAVFQCIREIGNCVILMQQLDAASRMMESTGYMQYAPFIGTPSVSKEASRGTTPLYRTVCAMVDKINGVWSGADKPPWSSSVTFEDVRRCAKCAEGLANEAARQTSTSYFKATVMLMERFIEPLRREVGGGAALAPGSTGLLDAEGSLEFHRLYSAIQFLTNMVEEGGESPDLEVFGEGLAWGGCILIHALGQQSRFNVLDYSYQLVKITDQFVKDPHEDPTLASQQHIAQFIQRARQGRQLNETIFDQLKAAVPKRPAHAAGLQLPARPAPSV